MSRGALALGCLALVLLVAGRLSAETTEILLTGPDQERGLPYLGANVIPYLSVTYGPPSKQGSPPASLPAADRIRVLYTDHAIVVPSDWKPAPCSAVALLVRSGPSPVYLHRDSRGWSLFFEFPPKAPQPCSFASTFVTRFIYFLGITRDSAYSSFPAVLHLTP